MNEKSSKENPERVFNPQTGEFYYEKLAQRRKITLPPASYSDYVRMPVSQKANFDAALQQSELLMDLAAHEITKSIAPRSTPEILILKKENQIAIGSVEIPNAKTLNPTSKFPKRVDVLTSSSDSQKENSAPNEDKKTPPKSKLENSSELCDVVRKFLCDADDNDENKMIDRDGKFFTIDFGRAFQYDYKSAKNMATELPNMYLDTFDGNDIQDFKKTKYQQAIDHVLELDTKTIVENIERRIGEFLKENGMEMSDFLINFKGEFKRFESAKDFSHTIGSELIESKKRLSVYNSLLKSIKDVDEVLNAADQAILEDIDAAPEFMVAAYLKAEQCKSLKPKISKTDTFLESIYSSKPTMGLDKSR